MVITLIFRVDTFMPSTRVGYRSLSTLHLFSLCDPQFLEKIIDLTDAFKLYLVNNNYHNYYLRV